MPNQVVSANMDPAVVESFGQEWQKFDHAQTSEVELRTCFEE